MQAFSSYERSNKKEKDGEKKMDMEENKKSVQNICRVIFRTAHLEKLI
jgi:hypothetical protein